MPSFIHYNILRKLDNTRSLYHAVDARTNARVVLKITRPASQAEQDRARLEARIYCQIKHQGIVQGFEHGETAQHVWVALELVEGSTLEEFLQNGWSPSHREVVGVLLQLASALDALAALGVVHGDVKPANVIVLRSGVVKLADFNASCSPHVGDENPPVPVIVGTPSIMAPEQLRGTDHVDHRSDVFSLGVLAYRLLTGRRPFEGLTIDEYAVALDNGRVPTCGLETVDHVFERALARDRVRRFPSAGAFVQALATGLDGQVARADPPTTLLDCAEPPTTLRVRAEPSGEAASHEPSARASAMDFGWLASLLAAAPLVAIGQPALGAVAAGIGVASRLGAYALARRTKKT